MAVNRQRGLLQLRPPQSVQAPVAAVGLGVSGQSGAVQAAQGIEQAAGSVANTFASLSQEIGAFADRAAAIEGRRVGTQAGLDPEFRPRRDGTIFGEAYDRAGLEAYGGQVRIAVEHDIESGGDLDAKRDAWLKRAPEELHPDIAFQFERGKLVKAREAARAEAARVKAEAIGTLQDELSVAIKGLHQRAFSLGGDATADAVLGAEIATLEAKLKRTGVDGQPLVSPDRARALLAQAKETVVDARLLGEFDRLENNGQRLAFLENLEDDFKNSKGLAKHYDWAGYQRIQSQLRGAFQAHAAAERQANGALRDELTRLTKWVEKGNGLPADQMASIRARIATGGGAELEAGLASLEDLVHLQGQLRAARPGQVAAYIRDQRAAMSEGGVTPQGVARLKLAEAFDKEMRVELERNQLGWADRVGYSKLVPLDFSTPETTATSFQARIVQAEDVARRYGRDVVYLTPDERRRLAVLASQGGANTIGIAQDIVRVAGDATRARSILTEIFPEGHVAAMIGGNVVAAGEPTRIARDAADGLALKRSQGFKSRAPSAEKARAAALAAHGGALTGLGETEQAAIETTNAAYEVRAQGLAEFDEGLWQRTFREVMGERVIGPHVYGGVVMSQPGHMFRAARGAVIVPPNMRQDRFLDAVRAIRAEDFGDDGPRYGNGGKVPTEVLRRALLIQAGEGKYALALGSAEEPKELRGADGETFVLDLAALEDTLRERVPDAYLGGSPAVQSERRPGESAIEFMRRAPEAALREREGPAGPGGAMGPQGPMAPAAPSALPQTDAAFAQEVTDLLLDNDVELTDDNIAYGIAVLARRYGADLTPEQIEAIMAGELSPMDAIGKAGRR